MKKQILLCLSFIILFCALCFGGVYESDHFIIQTELDHRFAEIVESVAETYYDNLLSYGLGSVSKKGADPDSGMGMGLERESDLESEAEGQLIVYYCETESEAKQLFKSHGHNNKQSRCYYAADVPAIYVYRRAEDGEYVGWRPLFYGIIYHLVNQKMPEAPVWFKEGVGCFFSCKGQLVKGELLFDSTNPKQQQVLRKGLEYVGRANIKRLYSSTPERFYAWDIGYSFAKVFFVWLSETGQLEKYMKAVRADGFELKVLEESLSKSSSKVNIELFKFIKRNVYADAYLADGRQADDTAEKTKAFLNALDLRPGYYAAYLDLAKLHYSNKEYEKSMQILLRILVNKRKRDCKQIAKLMAKTCYRQQDYGKSLDYYMKAWEYSDYDEYKYRLAFGIASCYYYLEDSDNAQKWYEQFLDGKWEAGAMQAAEKYAKKFIGHQKEQAKAREKAMGK